MTAARGTTYKIQMTQMDEEIEKLTDRLDKRQAQRKADQISTNSGEYLSANIKFVMEHIEEAPAKAK